MANMDSWKHFLWMGTSYGAEVIESYATSEEAIAVMKAKERLGWSVRLVYADSEEMVRKYVRSHPKYAYGF